MAGFGNPTPWHRQGETDERDGPHRNRREDFKPVNAFAAEIAVSCSRGQDTGADTLSREQELNRFFADIERRALRIAEIGVRNRDDALDLVQDAMIKLARKYADKPSAEWLPLFYRILQNGVRDHHRRQAVRNRVMVWMGRGRQGDDEYDVVAAAPDPAGRTPEERLASGEAMTDLESAIAALPTRQREAFMLRTFEGLDVRDTAAAMGVTEGSVKTHYSRAVHALRDALGEHWE